MYWQTLPFPSSVEEYWFVPWAGALTLLEEEEFEPFFSMTTLFHIQLCPRSRELALSTHRGQHLELQQLPHPLMQLIMELSSGAHRHQLLHR